MNASFHFKVLAIVVITLSGQFGAPVVRAQQAVPATATQPAPVQLSADVWDVLRMAQGNVGDTTLIAYVKNSGRVYALGASEILYLKERGLSDQVITAMLDQRKNLVPTNPPPAAQPSVWASSNPQPVPAPAQPAPAYAQPAPTYTQPATVYAQPSPVYVYPSYPAYDYWPYYGGYWGYPSVSVGFGWGWGGHYGGYRGWGYHGGGGHR